MSWDISVFAAKVPPSPVSDMPDDWRGEVLGSASEVRSRISECLPEVDWSDTKWGVYHGDGFSFELNVGSKDPNDGFMVHVRDRGRDGPLGWTAPPSEPDWQISRIRLSGRWFYLVKDWTAWLGPLAD